MPTAVIGVIVTLTLFVAGCIFQAGKLTARVEALEQWRSEQREQMNQIFEAIRALERLIRNGEN